MTDITFLTADQIENYLDVNYGIENITAQAAITDFAITLGGKFSSNQFVHDNNTLDNRAGAYWTKSSSDDNGVIISEYGQITEGYHVTDKNIGTRLVLPYSFIEENSKNLLPQKNEYDILEINYGYYPNQAPQKELQQLLEEKLENKEINKLEQTITVCTRDDNTDFSKEELAVYEYNHKLYTRVFVNTSTSNNSIILSNNEEYEDWDAVWLEISPIKWLVDTDKKIAVTKNIIFAGIPFNNNQIYKGDFNTTTIKKYLDEYFLKEIISLQSLVDTISQN